MAQVYSLWAAVDGEPDSAWLVAAVDYETWATDAETVEAAFDRLRTDYVGGDGFREVILNVDPDQIAVAFEIPEADATVEPGAPG